MSEAYYELSSAAQEAIEEGRWESMLAGITVHKSGAHTRSFYDSERMDIYDKKVGNGALGPYGYRDYYEQTFRRGLKSLDLGDGLVAVAWIDYVEAYPGFGGVAWEQRSDGFIVDTNSKSIVSRLDQGFQTIRTSGSSGAAMAYTSYDRSSLWHHNAGVSLKYDPKRRCLVTGWVNKEGDVCAHKEWHVPDKKELKKELVEAKKKKATAEFTQAIEAYHTDYEKVKECILAGADVNIRLAKGYGSRGFNETPLIKFAKRDGDTPEEKKAKLEIVELLLTHGADVDACDREKGQLIWDPPRPYKSALMYAAESGDIEMAKLLIDHGADIDQEITWMVYVDSNSVFYSGHYSERSRRVQAGTSEMREFLEKEKQRIEDERKRRMEAKRLEQERQAEERRLKENLESVEPDRKYLKQKSEQLRQEADTILKEVADEIKVLAPEKEDEESPRHKRAEKLKALRREFGSRAAIEGARELRAKEEGDELERQARKEKRQKLYGRSFVAEQIRKKRKEVISKLAAGSLDRRIEADRIRQLRKDIKTKPKAIKAAQTKLEKAKQRLADFRSKEDETFPGMAESNARRKTMRESVAKLRQEEQALRSDIRSGIETLAPEKEDEESPRHKRAEKLKALKREFGSRAAIEGSKTLKERDTTDEMDRAGRKGLRQKLYEQKKQADSLAADHQALMEELTGTTEDRDTHADQIHDLRRDRDAKQRSLDKITGELERAEKSYGDLRKRFKPKTPPKPEQPQQVVTPQQDPAQPVLAPKQDQKQQTENFGDDIEERTPTYYDDPEYQAAEAATSKPEPPSGPQPKPTPTEQPAQQPIQQPVSQQPQKPQPKPASNGFVSLWRRFFGNDGNG